MTDQQAISQQIIQLCQTPHTALQAIHLLICHKGATELAFQSVYDRVIEDGDVDGAYYLAVFAQKVDDLPFDGLPLIEMVMKNGDDNMRLSLLEKLPKEMRTQYI
ncbi:hypothetical protein [Moraxella oblonga]|uniref:hypothetical protein n=1 Tax=Moraxella oblonga TaxID=200413 RepID=UPI00082B9139|nr:hypothetical protein [Moraxella oblonga]